MHNFIGFPGVKFIAKQNFDTEYGHHEAGSVVKEAAQFPNLDVLVSAGYLLPYSPENGYDYLPPHLFSATMTREEAIAKIVGDPHAKEGVAQFEDGTPDVVKEALVQAETQHVAYAAIMAQAARNQRQRDEHDTDDETVLPQEPKVVEADLKEIRVENEKQQAEAVERAEATATQAETPPEPQKAAKKAATPQLANKSAATKEKA